MEITQRTKQKYKMVDLVGEISSFRDALLFKEILEKMVREGHLHVAVNFDKAKSLSSDFVNAIMTTHIALKKRGGEIVLIGHDLTINETLSIVGIPLIMSVYLDEKSFDEECVRERK